MPEERKLEADGAVLCAAGAIAVAVYLPVIEARFMTFDDIVLRDE